MKPRPILLALALLCTGAPLAAQPAAEVTLVFAGDIMLDELPGRAVARGEDPFAGFAPLLDRADLAVGNLECAATQGGKAVDKPFTFRAHPRVLDVLARHFGAVSLANNHTGDFGAGGLLDSLRHLTAAHLPFFGAGRTLSEAHQPLVLYRKGIRIALLGYDEFLPRSFEAGPSTPGVAWSEDEQVLRDLRAARAAGAQVVIPFLHWGWEHEPRPCARQRELARTLIDAGADAVVGTHPHITQDPEVYRGKLILYSLGDFVFNGFTEESANTGWLLHLTLDQRGVRRWYTVVARLDERGLPRIAPDRASPCGDARSGQVESCRMGKTIAKLGKRPP